LSGRGGNVKPFVVGRENEAIRLFDSIVCNDRRSALGQIPDALGGWIGEIDVAAWRDNEVIGGDVRGEDFNFSVG